MSTILHLLLVLVVWPDLVTVRAGALFDEVAPCSSTDVRGCVNETGCVWSGRCVAPVSDDIILPSPTVITSAPSTATSAPSTVITSIADGASTKDANEAAAEDEADGASTQDGAATEDRLGLELDGSSAEAHARSRGTAESAGHSNGAMLSWSGVALLVATYFQVSALDL